MVCYMESRNLQFLFCSLFKILLLELSPRLLRGNILHPFSKSYIGCWWTGELSIYKILLYAYKALNGLAPEYLSNMVESYAPDRVLRSASQNLLVVPRGKHCQYGMRTFAMAAATLWNFLNVRDRGNKIHVLSMFYYFMLYHSNALEFIIERHISIVYYYYY